MKLWIFEPYSSNKRGREKNKLVRWKVMSKEHFKVWVRKRQTEMRHISRASFGKCIAPTSFYLNLFFLLDFFYFSSFQPSLCTTFVCSHSIQHKYWKTRTKPWLMFLLSKRHMKKSQRLQMCLWSRTALASADHSVEIHDSLSEDDY